MAKRLRTSCITRLFLLVAVGVSCMAHHSAGPRASSCRYDDESNASAVDLAHCLVLGTRPDPVTAAQWSKRLDRYEVSRKKLIQALFQSAQSQTIWNTDERTFVRTLFVRLLRREPDEETLNRWTGLIRAGRPRRSMLRMLITSDEFDQLYPIFRPHPTSEAKCPRLRALANIDDDASVEIQRCIDAAPDGAALSLPPGRYWLESTIRLHRPLVLRTEGIDYSSPPCSSNPKYACAELIASARHHGGPLVLSEEDAVGIVVDHLVMNGNRAGRQSSRAGCEHPALFGPVFVANANRNLVVINSFAINALCSTGLGVSGDAELRRNVIAGNGVHNEPGLWADGMTLVLHDSWVTDNEIRDNTDVDVIFGACPNCDIQDNHITHGDGSDWFQRSSFAALMIHAWPDTSGDYSNADVSGNTIDCGPHAACGFGLLLGAQPWYEASLFGGVFHNNKVRSAQQGLAVNGATGPIVLYNNVVEDSGGRPNSSCQKNEGVTVTTSAYSIAPSSRRLVDLSADRGGHEYAALDFKGCLLNSWRSRSCQDLGGLPSSRPCIDGKPAVGIAYDAAFCCLR